MNILIADDHPLFRIALKSILAEEMREAEFGEACNAQQTLELVWKQDWAVLVLDITMPGRSGLDILKELKEARPKMAILVLSSHAEDQFAVRCLRSGASGYLTKETAPKNLVGAVRKVMEGGKYVSSFLAEKLASMLDKDASRPLHESLSDREFQVLRMIAEGKAPKEIAADLAISIKTVSTYRLRILEKLHLRSIADIIQYSLQNNLYGQ